MAPEGIQGPKGRGGGGARKEMKRRHPKSHHLEAALLIFKNINLFICVYVRTPEFEHHFMGPVLLIFLNSWNLPQILKDDGF